MGIYVEKIGGWADRYIFTPIFKICLFIVYAAIAIGALAVPIAAIKYLLKG